MVRISIPTSRNVNVPLLIDATQLEALDQIIDTHWGPMQEYKERKIAAEASDKVKKYLREGIIRSERAAEFEQEAKKEYAASYSYREERKFSLYLTKGREILAHRFSEAFNQPIDGEETTVGFELSVRVGEITAKVQLRPGWSENMTVTVQPNHVDAAQSLFGALSNWATAVEAPRWQQKWVFLRPLTASILFLWVSFGAGAVPLVNWGEGGRASVKHEAREMLAQGGVNEKNERQAIQLILAMESGYDPASSRPPVLGIKYWSYFLLGGAILAALSICPRVCIGLWKGRRRLGAWRIWMRTLTIGIPTLIGINVFLPWILYWLKLTPPNP